jgi:cytochrome c peroxidase
MSPAAVRGEKIFRGKGGCASCHLGPLFTDNLIHNTGVPQEPGNNDAGSTAVPGGGFNTPALRDDAATAPYMHNGILPTLRDVVIFYDRNTVLGPLHLKANEMDDLVAYLEAL